MTRERPEPDVEASDSPKLIDSSNRDGDTEHPDTLVVEMPAGPPRLTPGAALALLRLLLDATPDDRDASPDSLTT